jgi:hypothetical protein
LVLTCIEPTTFVLAFLLHFEVLGGEARRAVTMPDTIGKDTFRRCRSGSASASTATNTAAGTIAIVVSASSILASAAAVHDDMCFSPIAVSLVAVVGTATLIQCWCQIPTSPTRRHGYGPVDRARPNLAGSRPSHHRPVRSRLGLSSR